MKAIYPKQPVRIRQILCLLAGVLCFSGTAWGQLKFIPNQGQWPAKAKYKANLSQGDLWVTDSGLLFSLWDPASAEKIHNRTLNRMVIKHHAFYLHFKNGSFADVRSAGENTSEYYNYFLGNDPSRWKSGIYGSSELFVKNLYPGIDLQLFSENGNLKYNLICNPGSDPSVITIQYPGADSLQLQNGHIEIFTSVQEITEAMPAVYGINGSSRSLLQASYQSAGGTIRIQLPQGVQRRYNQIIIDPILVFSTYTGSRADNFGCTGTYDDLGDGISGGTVFSSGFPLSIGAFQTTFGGGVPESLGYGDGRDAGILKYTPDGTKLIFATYLGGSNNEQPHSMVADAAGNVYVMGSTRSTDFPTTTGAYDRSQNGNYDFFVCQLQADGKKLLASTFVGGNGMDAVGADRENEPIDNFELLYNYADEFRGEIITDGQNVYVAGITYSTNFPRSLNSGWFGGKEEGCAFSLSGDLKTLNWSQLVGGQGYDAFYGICLGKFNDLYLAGGTSTQDLPSRFSQWNNTYLGGIADAMVVRLNKSSGAMLQAHYLGTSAYEQAYFAQTDNSGNPYFFGQTEGAVSILNAPFNQPGRGQFIIRMDTVLKTVTMSTSFGGNNNKPNISPSAFLVDQCERIFVSGWGGTPNSYLYDEFTFKPKTHRNTGSTYQMPLSADAFQKSTDGSDFYLAVFNKNMYSLAYATYFGGIGNASKEADEHVDGGTSRFDKKGIIYQAVCAGCGKNGLFPTTPGAYSRTNNSNNCNNALFKIDFENLNKKPSMRDTFLEGVATDVFNLDITGADPDPWDSLFIDYQITVPAGSTGAAKPVIQTIPGLQKARIILKWNTSCDNFSTDTFTLKVMVHDHGCPHYDTGWAYIRILIKQPPPVIPDYAVCVSFDRQTKELKIAWPASNPPVRFFNYYVLKRTNPDLSVIVLDTIRNANAGIFTDKTVVSPETNNYCYYMEGFNTCGHWEKSKDLMCTIGELNSPIKPTHVKFVTVENDKRVRLEWESVQEPDFKEFELYRFPRGGTVGSVPYRYVKDTFALDSALNVDYDSYCYSLIVTDKCGHISKQSNMGCNVIINGTAHGRPNYSFDLSWNDYLDWALGVKDWKLERQYASNPWTLEANTGTLQKQRDSLLDYDWGGYWYRVTATEQLKGQSRLPYQSQSNWIYLYQPPELWVPNAFTPNENGINDIWGTVPVFVRNYNMKVYNRWGQKVWESSDKKKQWDGRVNGVLAEDGVFAWYVVFDGWDDKTYTLAGTVTIFR